MIEKLDDTIPCSYESKPEKITAEIRNIKTKINEMIDFIIVLSFERHEIPRD